VARSRKGASLKRERDSGVARLPRLRGFRVDDVRALHGAVPDREVAEAPLRVLVTGNAGFIGFHLAELLARRGHTVFGLDARVPEAPTPGVEHHACDLLDTDAVQRTIDAVRPDAIAHLAAVTHIHGTSLADYAPNVAGVEHLSRAIARNGRVQRVVCTSTQLVRRVGHAPRSDEDYDPATVYGESKVRTEQIWRRADGGGTTWCLVRPTTIWGPGMNPHYLRFFGMIRKGRYVHVGRQAVHKTYGFVGNTTHQYAQLLEAPAASIQRRTFYLGDYEPIDLRAWAEAFRAELGAPPIRTVPVTVARAVAKVGDAVNAIGFDRFPFNSFRLRNVMTPSVVDLSATEAVCGPLPYSPGDGIVQTATWLRANWSGSTAVPRIAAPERAVLRDA
jgi:nucleoside-diphosphate-sugar epimerase